jgi:hypothetical protein
LFYLESVGDQRTKFGSITCYRCLGTSITPQ